VHPQQTLWRIIVLTGSPREVHNVEARQAAEKLTIVPCGSVLASETYCLKIGRLDAPIWRLSMLFLGVGLWNMEFMLAISTDTLPQTSLSYVAFRISFQETYERIVLSRQMGEDIPDRCGFLTEVPFLKHVPAHVQLDLLAKTWSRHVDQVRVEADLVDESVVYATCETAARLVEDEPTTAQRFLTGGPLETSAAVDRYLASELRALHLNLSNEGDFLMISQFEDMVPDAARALKQKFELDEERLEAMFDVLGLWRISDTFTGNLAGLLTEAEIARVAFELDVKVES